MSVMLLSTFTLLLALVIILAGTLAFVITREAGQNVEGHRKCFLDALASLELVMSVRHFFS